MAGRRQNSTGPRPSRARNKPNSRLRRGPHESWFYVRHAVLWGVLAFVAYWGWLDREVASAFEARRWALPARLYARPLELYSGAEITKAALIAELERLGYRRVTESPAPGQYAVSPTKVALHARGFDFWDVPEPPRRVLVTFKNERVGVLLDPRADTAGLLRLEPVEIGRINPPRFEDRSLLSIGQIPVPFQAALIAVEDRRFRNHFGVDLLGLARAMLANLETRRFVQGGSTITQQLVKNLYLSRERTVRRKFNEMLMAMSLERRYTKDEILETYVNEVFLGQDGNRAIHGFGLAARFYFGKPLAELDAAESATLIGMIKGPSIYDPRRHPHEARARRGLVLQLMSDAGVIDAGSARVHAEERLVLRTRTPGAAPSPAFNALVKRQLLRDYDAADLRVAGLNIFTTLDSEVQRAAEAGVRDSLNEIERRHNLPFASLQAGAVIIEPATGEVLAVVGDRKPGYAGFNRALDARRPIGSLVKPFVYALALEQPQEYSLVTRLADESVSLTDANAIAWTPKNFDGKAHGEVSMLDALVRSYNLATVDLGLQLELEAVAKYLRKLGVAEAVPAYPSILLGAVDMSPLALAELYAVLANDGFYTPLRAITAVTDQQHHKLKRYGLTVRSVMHPTAAALTRFALTRVVDEGTARNAPQLLGGVRPLAGKTGTSNDHRDSWFAGFGDNRLGVVWVGRDDNASTGLTGASGALRVWATIMGGTGLRPLSLSFPPEVEWRAVAADHLAVLAPSCAGDRMLPFHKRSRPPVAACDGALEVNRGGGLVDKLRDLLH